MVYYSAQSRRPLLLLSHTVRRLLGPACAICRRATTGTADLCRSCQEILDNQRVNPSRQCLRCALEPGSQTPQAEDFALDCGECSSNPPPFERTIAALRYGPSAAFLVNRLKHHHQLGCLRPMAALMIEAIEQRLSDPARQIDLLVPVPLPAGRLSQRGFNQALELAKPLAARFGLAIDRHSCVALGEHRPRQQLGAAQRRTGLRQRFGVDTSVVGKRVAIVDDVVTTTSTVRALGEALITAGAVSCEVWCFARTPKDR